MKSQTILLILVVMLTRFFLAGFADTSASATDTLVFLEVTSNVS